MYTFVKLCPLLSDCLCFCLILTELTQIEVIQSVFFRRSLTIHSLGNEMWNVNINANVSVRLLPLRTYRLEIVEDTIVQYLCAVEAAA